MKLSMKFGLFFRLLLAAMHHNENSQNVQAVKKDGNPRYSITFPKQRKGEFTVTKIKTQRIYGMC